VSKKEDVISLNPQFLNFLMSPEKADTASKEFTEALNLLASQNLRKFDPFDRVVLSNKGIDNPILTSFRTLAKTNNSLSETFKIIHNKFMADSNAKKRSLMMNKSEGKSKTYMLNPPPDLSSFEDPFLQNEESALYSSEIRDFNNHHYLNNSQERPNDPYVQLKFRNSKTTTAKSSNRMRLYESIDRIKETNRNSLIPSRGFKERDYKTKNSTIVHNRAQIENSELYDSSRVELVQDASVVLPE